MSSMIFFHKLNIFQFKVINYIELNVLYDYSHWQVSCHKVFKLNSQSQFFDIFDDINYAVRRIKNLKYKHNMAICQGMTALNALSVKFFCKLHFWETCLYLLQVIFELNFFYLV